MSFPVLPDCACPVLLTAIPAISPSPAQLALPPPLCSRGCASAVQWGVRSAVQVLCVLHVSRSTTWYRMDVSPVLLDARGARSQQGTHARAAATPTT